MNIQADTPPKPHTSQLFEGELIRLHQLILEMTGLVVYQLEQTLQAMDDADPTMADRVIDRDRDVDRYELKIDTEVLQLLARHSPVANDLRTIVSVSKISVELENLGDAIVSAAKLIKSMFNPDTSDPNPKLLADIAAMGDLVKTMLGKLLIALESRDSNRAYILFQYDRECENELEQGIRHQLSFVIDDARLISRSLMIMQVMKTLEHCGEHCRNIAEYLIFMFEGLDIRHNHLSYQRHRFTLE